MAKKQRIPRKVKSALLDRFQCCAVCGQWDANDAGHIIPEAQGGAATLGNLILLCAPCNQSQGAVYAPIKHHATPLDHLSVTAARELIIKRRALWARYCNTLRARATLSGNFTKLKQYSPCKE